MSVFVFLGWKEGVKVASTKGIGFIPGRGVKMLHRREPECRMAKVQCPSQACLTSYPFLTFRLLPSVWPGGGACPLRLVPQPPLRADFQLRSASLRHRRKTEGREEGGTGVRIPLALLCFASDSILWSSCLCSAAVKSVTLVLARQPHLLGFGNPASSLCPPAWGCCGFRNCSSWGTSLSTLTSHFFCHPWKHFLAFKCLL